MAHPRKLIREEIVSILKSEVPSVADTSIFESRIEPIFDRAILPAIAVYTKSESSEAFNDHHRIYQRDLEIAVEILVQGNNDTDDAIDDICEEIEAALNSTRHERSSNYQSIELTQTEVAFLAEGSRPKAAARLTFLIKYETQEI
jgi:hypothetical protein